MKIRIFALAKELGFDSKELIERCNEAGIQVKSSALASISPAERDTLLEYLESSKSGSNGDAGPQSTPAPEPVVESQPKKMRNIQVMRPRPQHADGGAAANEDEATPETAESDPTEEPVVEAEAAPEAVPAESEETDEAAEPVATESAEPEPVESESDEAESEDVKSDSVDDSEADAPAASGPDEEADSPTETATPDKPAEPMQQSDYVPGSGSSQKAPPREMRPVGTQDREIRRRKQAEKKTTTPNVPNLAVPNYTPPKVAKGGGKGAEVKAQKPDVALTPEALLKDSSPLRERVRRHQQDKASGKPTRRGGLKEEAVREEERQRRIDREQKRARRGGDDGGGRPRRSARPRRNRNRGPIEYGDAAVVELPITVRSLSEAMGRPAKQIMTAAFQLGTPVRITDGLGEEEALEIALELGVDLEIDRGRDLEEELAELLDAPDPEESLEPRPPVVTILGHVDHGKTSLLDRIRSANVTEGEAGGITQHIAAYQVEKQGKKITFVDTPGHAAFGEMRARGANVTDVIVLVVAADDGVMPQTIECIAHAKSANVPIMVALNKMDLPGVDEQKAFQGLAQHELLPTDWGGEVEVVRTSAETGDGIDNLLETILLTAELHEEDFRANPNRNAVGVCLEAFRDEGRGALAWFLVQKGTLRIGDVVLCGSTYGRIRAMYNDRDEEIEEAGPSMPIKVAGLNEVPGAGDHFYVMDDVDEARDAADEREHVDRTESLATRSTALPRSLADILEAAQRGEVQDLPLIIKADTPGSIEAIKGELGRLDHPEVQVNVLHSAVGGVNESDVMLASASGAVIVAFHVIPEDRAAQLADREGVDIQRFDIIYQLTDTIKARLEGLLRAERIKVPTGRALVLRVFEISRLGKVAGCRVLSGSIERTNTIQVSRDQTVLNDYNINSLRREKDDVKEVREGMECGILLQNFRDVKEGDLLDAYKIEERQRTLDE